MPHLNVEVDQDTVTAVKVASARSGMLLRKWVERALKQAASAEARQPQPIGDEAIRVLERQTADDTLAPGVERIKVQQVDEE